MIALTVFFVLFCALLTKCASAVASWLRHVRYLKAHIPEAPGRHWLRGNWPADDKASKGVFLNRARMLPRMSLIWFGPVTPQITLTHPEALADAMRSSPDRFQFLYEFLRPWLGNGLLMSDGKHWSRDRRLLSQAFTPEMLREYVSCFKEASTSMLNMWSTAAEQEKSVNVARCMPLLTFDVIVKCTLGVDTECQTDTYLSSPHGRYFSAVNDILDLTFARVLNPLQWWDFIYFRTAVGRKNADAIHYSHAYCEELIRKRRKELEQDPDDSGADQRSCKTMLDILLTVKDEDGVGMNDVEIREQVETFLFGGRDTGAATLQWAMYYLTEYPDIQEKCRSEVQQVMDACGGVDGFKHEHISQLQYVSQFLQEVLRDACIVAHLRRTMSKEAVVDGVTLPAGTQIEMDMFGIHHNAQVWEDPQTFNPDRFAPGTKRHPYALIPFSVGPRNCIGKHFVQDELKVALALILMRFVLLPDQSSEKPYWRQKGTSVPHPNLFIKVKKV